MDRPEANLSSDVICEKYDGPIYFIWSNEHGAWWRPQSAGYTSSIESAGIYTANEALAICRGRDGWNGKSRPSEIAVPVELTLKAVQADLQSEPFKCP